jgi:hypothetical protein
VIWPRDVLRQSTISRSSAVPHRVIDSLPVDQSEPLATARPTFEPRLYLPPPVQLRARPEARPLGVLRSGRVPALRSRIPKKDFQRLVPTPLGQAA